MDAQSILDLKKEILSPIKRASKRQLGTGQESLVHSEVQRRLAVGISQKEGKKDDFQLEIRVQMGGWALQKAKEIRQEIGAAEVNIEVIPQIEIPSRDTLRTFIAFERHSRGLREQIRPLHIGLSVGHLNGGAGTLGAFVDIKKKGVAILSCTHVLAPTEQADTGNYIFQPGKPDKSRFFANDRIARLGNYGFLAKEDRNKTDSADAILLKDVDYGIPNQIPKKFPMGGKMIHHIPKSAFNLLSRDKVVYKIGRTTGFTRGKVSAVALDNVPVRTNEGDEVLFDDVIEINWLSNRQPFSKPGDSGSIVFTEDNSKLFVVGFHFAGGIKKINNKEVGVSYSCNIDTVLKDHKALWLS